MNRSSFLIVALLGLTLMPYPTSPAVASCAAPYLKLDDEQVLERGAAMTVEGRAFVDGCQDSMGCESSSFGCEECTYDEPPEEPMEDVVLHLVQGERTWELDVADAGSAEDNHLGWVTWTFQLPAEVERGPARLVPDGGQSVRITVR